MSNRYLDLAATGSVKRMQERFGSRAAYARQEGGPALHDELGPDERAFIEEQDTFFIATVNEAGWPYVQHRGGPPGFLHALDGRTLAFPEFPGNRQYLSFGNLQANDRVSLFLIDFPARTRLKIFGRATLVELADDPALATALAVAGMRPRPERALVVRVEAFDWNCPKYIVPRFTEREVRALLDPLRARVAELEAELKARGA